MFNLESELLALMKDVEVKVYDNYLKIKILPLEKNNDTVDTHALFCKDMIRMRMILTKLRNKLTEDEKEKIEFVEITGNTCIPSILLGIGLLKVFNRSVILKRKTQFEWRSEDLLDFINSYRCSLIRNQYDYGEFESNIVKILMGEINTNLVDINLL